MSAIITPFYNIFIYLFQFVNIFIIHIQKILGKPAHNVKG